ncbi:MAG TPA: hypothetical protein EYH37_02165 [Aquifex aeolicus]|uniref:Uncharacterized protein n=1 Tax=Aquifex aeolicus TaxID=63363 RepID=A0A9D0YP53_AQUAO|nr:hypothetical protein [Aquifex aeolicus]
MEIWLFVTIGISAVLIGGTILISKKGKKTSSEVSEEYEIIEDEAPAPSISVSEEEETGCPEEIKKQLLNKQKQIFKEAHKVYMVLNNILKNKNLSPELKKEFETFIRSYNRLKELEEEIQVYPFGDCDRVFELKFNFYNKMVKETAKKIMVLAKTLK